MSVDTIGIMFDDNNDFPTVAQVIKETSYINEYMLNLPEDFMTWKAIAYDPTTLRYGEEDSEAIDTTNWEALLDNLTAVPVTVFANYSPCQGGWETTGIEEARDLGIALLCSSNQILALHPDASVDLEAMAGMARRLADYPLLDEEAYSALEWEAWEKWAPEAFRDELRQSPYSEDDTEWLGDHAEELLPTLQQHLHYNYGFSGEYSPTFLSIIESLGGIDVMKGLVENVTKEN